MKSFVFHSIFFIIISLLLIGCIDDGFSTSPNDQPVFSTDTLDMGVVFTAQMTTTHRFTVKNPSPKSISINSITLGGDNADVFRLNVDGFSGESFHNVEIRGKDSIFVFAEATLPFMDMDTPTKFEAKVNFTTNGVAQSVVLKAYGQDAIPLNACVIDQDTRLNSPRPYLIYDSLVVAAGATLTLDEGVKLLFHDKAYLAVDGKLTANGTPEKPIIFSGDRMGNVVSDISFDLMSRQWDGVYIRNASSENFLSHTVIKNTINGVHIVTERESPSAEYNLKLQNCLLRNSGTTVLSATHSKTTAVGCEFAEAGEGLVVIHGGDSHFNHCTFSNNYLFSALTGPAISFGHINADTDDLSDFPYGKAVFSNSIIYGLGKDLSHGDLTGTDIFFLNSLFKSDGSDDENFVDCLWASDPLFRTIRSEYYFDYRLSEESPAISAANPSLNTSEADFDFYGNSRGDSPDIGAYVYVPESGSED